MCKFWYLKNSERVPLILWMWMWLNSRGPVNIVDVDNPTLREITRQAIVWSFEPIRISQDVQRIPLLHETGHRWFR